MDNINLENVILDIIKMYGESQRLLGQEQQDNDNLRKEIHDLKNLKNTKTLKQLRKIGTIFPNTSDYKMDLKL